MEQRQLGRSGLKVPALCLGAMTFGESRTFMKGVTSPDDEARRVLDAALDAGISFIDTANVYSEGHSEELLGEWLGTRRQQVILATKCRFPVPPAQGQPGPNDSGLSRKHILQACDDSLRRLRTDYIDLYQVHMQDRATPIDETLRALDDLVRAGKVRYVGASNYTGYRLVESLWAADRRGTARYESVQLQWNLIERGAEREVIPACRTFGLGVLVWSPLARGFLSGKYLRGQAPASGTRLEVWKDTFAKMRSERNFDVVEAVVQVAARLGQSPASVALAWLLGKTDVSSVIIGARTLAQLRENLSCLELTLPEAERRALDEASRPDWGYPQDFISMREAW
jgi:aryl-alcohol dehydrogenase-like predicted oxidoreductase